MKTVNVETEKILNMIVQNEDHRQNHTGGNFGRIVITPLKHIEYVYPSPGTYYTNCHNVDPEEFLNIDEIEKDYSLDLIDFQTVSKDNVAEETGIKIEDFDDDEWDKVSTYINEWIDQWKNVAIVNKKQELIIISDGSGEEIEKFKIEWG